MCFDGRGRDRRRRLGHVSRWNGNRHRRWRRKRLTRHRLSNRLDRDRLTRHGCTHNLDWNRLNRDWLHAYNLNMDGINGVIRLFPVYTLDCLSFVTTNYSMVFQSFGSFSLDEILPCFELGRCFFVEWFINCPEFYVKFNWTGLSSSQTSDHQIPFKYAWNYPIHTNSFTRWNKHEYLLHCPIPIIFIVSILPY